MVVSRRYGKSPLRQRWWLVAGQGGPRCTVRRSAAWYRRRHDVVLHARDCLRLVDTVLAACMGNEACMVNVVL